MKTFSRALTATGVHLACVLLGASTSHAASLCQMDEIANGLERSGLLAYSDGHYHDAEHAFVEAIRLTENQGGPLAPGLTQLLSDLAWLHYTEGRFDKADSLLREALARDQKAFGPDDVERTAARTAELGMLYHAEGKFIEAGPLLHRALFLYEQSPKTQMCEIGIIQNQIGLNYWAMGDLVRGERLIKNALVSLEVGETKDGRYWAAAMLDFAELCLAGHRDAEAKRAFERALTAAEDLRQSIGLDNGFVFHSHSVLLRRTEGIRTGRPIFGKIESCRAE